MQCPRWLRVAATPAVLRTRRAHVITVTPRGTQLLARATPCVSLLSLTSAPGALVCSRRCQSASLTEKKYQCSICGKGFRLEMAAKVHLQQVHQGQGSVVAGAVTGTESQADPSSSAEPSLHASAPSSPTYPTEPTPSVGLNTAGLSRSAHGLSSYAPFRKQRPTPKPLNEPENDLSQAALRELLGVWDDIGVRRLGDAFIHSSMIVRVSAAVSHAVTGESSVPPDAAGSHSSRAQESGIASAEASTNSPHSFGQLPMYGQPLPGTAVPEPSRATVASPFTASATMSPFAAAAAVNSPFAQAPSPFVDGGRESVGAALHTSPFLSNSGASPFPATDTESPFPAGEPTPFGAFPPTPASLSFSPTAVMSAQLPEVAPQIPCAVCGKTFSSHDGMRMHAKAKHDVVVPRDTSRSGRRGRRAEGVPDLPPYVPSPVDIEMTVPFGSVEAEHRWDDTVLRLHSTSVNNILLVGRVAEVVRTSEGKTQVCVAVKSTDSEETETFLVHCAASLPLHDIVVGCAVCVQGSLRLRAAETSASSTTTYYVPLIVVSEVSGLIAAIDSP